MIYCHNKIRGELTIRTLVISDIHGCYDQFIDLIKKIKLTKEDELVILGDQVDRGPRNMDVVLKIHEMKKDGYNIITLRGNHESMFLYGAKHYHSLKDLENSIDHKTLSGNGTAVSLAEYYELADEKKVKIIEELLSQKYYYEKDGFLFVHAGVIPNVDLEKQVADDLLWAREEFTHLPHNLPYTVIFGHTPTIYLNPDKELKIFHGEDKIGIDCGCVFGGKLACLDVFNNIEYYVDGYIKS